MLIHRHGDEVYKLMRGLFVVGNGQHVGTLIHPQLEQSLLLHPIFRLLDTGVESVMVSMSAVVGPGVGKAIREGDMA